MTERERGRENEIKCFVCIGGMIVAFDRFMVARINHRNAKKSTKNEFDCVCSHNNNTITQLNNRSHDLLASRSRWLHAFTQTQAQVSCVQHRWFFVFFTFESVSSICASYKVLVHERSLPLFLSFSCAVVFLFYCLFVLFVFFFSSLLSKDNGELERYEKLMCG